MKTFDRATMKTAIVPNMQTASGHNLVVYSIPPETKSLYATLAKHEDGTFSWVVTVGQRLLVMDTVKGGVNIVEAKRVDHLKP